MEQISAAIKVLLVKMDVQPSSYKFLFPPSLEQSEIDMKVRLGVFPTIPDLAPALTYALILSISRLILHYILFKVRLQHSNMSIIVKNVCLQCHTGTSNVFFFCFLPYRHPSFQS